LAVSVKNLVSCVKPIKMYVNCKVHYGGTFMSFWDSKSNCFSEKIIWAALFTHFYTSIYKENDM